MGNPASPFPTHRDPTVPPARATSLPPVQFWKGAVLPLLPQESQFLHPSSPLPFPRRFPLSHGGWFALAASQLPAAVTSGARKSPRWGMGAGPRKEQTRAPKPRPSVRKCPESRYTHCPARGQEPATGSPCQPRATGTACRVSVHMASTVAAVLQASPHLFLSPRCHQACPTQCPFFRLCAENSAASLLFSCLP